MALQPRKTVIFIVTAVRTSNRVEIEVISEQSSSKNILTYRCLCDKHHVKSAYGTVTVQLCAFLSSTTDGGSHVSVSVVSFLKSNFPLSLPFDFGNTSQFSKQSPRINRKPDNPPPIDWEYNIFSLPRCSQSPFARVVPS
jgi:hypothetical protein